MMMMITIIIIIMINNNSSSNNNHENIHDNSNYNDRLAARKGRGSPGFPTPP